MREMFSEKSPVLNVVTGFGELQGNETGSSKVKAGL